MKQVAICVLHATKKMVTTYMKEHALNHAQMEPMIMKMANVKNVMTLAQLVKPLQMKEIVLHVVRLVILVVH